MAGPFECRFDEILLECNLPGDVMVSILLNLPVKSLLRFMAVSKPWCCFISSPRFVNLHLRRQSLVANNNNHLLLSSDQPIYGLVNHIHEKNNTFVDTDVLILENPPIFESCPESSTGENPDFMVLDSCNGLVCLCCVEPILEGGLTLWNPATRKCRRIQLPDHAYFRLSFISLGLFYVEATSDFKIVGWADTHSHIRRPSLYVYTLSSDSWNKWDWICNDAEKSPIYFGSSTLVGGCMHWLSNTSASKSVIAAFDVTRGAMSFFGVPDSNSRKSTRTLAIKGCLSLVTLSHFGNMESEFEVWVMEEYGVEDSWVKRFTIQEPALVLLPLTCWNEAEMVVKIYREDSNILAFYDLFNNKRYYLEFKSFPVGLVFPYGESLVSVGTDREEIAPSQVAEG